jgi:DNA helicase-2/ATP-dependent DNA helicase PcrA
MLENLNENQKIAVEHKDGPLLIFAGAGSGKTKVLTNRVAYLINNYGVSPYNILAITFTNKAANEMKDRTVKMLGLDTLRIQISTFHSFGLLLIKRYYYLLDLKPNFTIIDSDDSLSTVKKILKDMNYDSKFYNPKNIRNRISSAKNELMTPDDLDKFTNNDMDEVVVKVYRAYEAKLKSNNSLDFDDLLMLPIKLFKEHKDVLEIVQEQYKYILVDEYQDINEVQYVLTKMISAKYKNICVVGDPDQSIYGFRGSNYKNILNFEHDYKNAKVILLEQNYRSTKTILNAANSVIKNNKNRKEKELWTDNEDGNLIKYRRCEDQIDEANFVRNGINKLIDDGVPLNEIAVLYRTNAQSRNIEEALLKDNIPYKVVGSFYFYNRKEIKDLIAYLKLIYNPSDDLSLERVINEPKRGIGLKTIETIRTKATALNDSMFNTIEKGKELEFKKLILSFIEASEELSLTELVDLILDKTGIRHELELEDTIESQSRLENLEEFKSITMNFEEEEGSVSLEEFLLQTSLVSDVEEYKNDPNRISLMTVHSVKGLEFNHVFVVGMEEGIFPHMNSLMENSEIEEERRLCYVAITRAKDDLHLVNARRRTLFGNEQINSVSRFIGEISKDLIETNVKDEELPQQQEKIEIGEMFREEEVDYQVGDFVYHETFGTGKVVEVSNTLVSVAFKHPHGIKKLMKNHKKLSKV